MRWSQRATTTATDNADQQNKVRSFATRYKENSKSSVSNLTLRFEMRFAQLAIQITHYCHVMLLWDLQDEPPRRGRKRTRTSYVRSPLDIQLDNTCAAGAGAAAARGGERRAASSMDVHFHKIYLVLAFNPTSVEPTTLRAAPRRQRERDGEERRGGERRGEEGSCPED